MLDLSAIEVDRNVDLSDFSRHLSYRQLAHRISEVGETQVVWVSSVEAAEAVAVAHEQFIRGELPIVSHQKSPNRRGQSILRTLLSSPLTLTVIVANLLCFPISLGFLQGSLSADWLALLTFTDFTEMGGRIRFADFNHTLVSGEWWRLVSPMLIHFGWLHLVFNLLWVWELGRRIEIRSGPLLLVSLIIISSVTANLLQYGLYGIGLFGGMSGVVFGLLGYSLVWSRRLPALDMGVQPGIYIFMLVYLVVGFTGAIDLLGLGSIANGAHLGGLLGGAVLAWLATVWKNRALSNPKKV